MTLHIPTTWFDAGVGVFGEFGRGWRYRVYVMAPLDATQFSADEGLAESAQKGSQSTVRHWAGTGRAEYLGIRRLALGASAWSGRTNSGSALFAPRVTVAEVDGRGRVGSLDLRGEFAQVFIGDAGELNRLRALREGIDPNVASRMLGAYLERASTMAISATGGGRLVRYGDSIPSKGCLRLPSTRGIQSSAWVLGVS